MKFFKIKICLSFSILFILSFYVDKDHFSVSFAQNSGNDNSTEKIVTIPKGSANPEVDITKFSAKKWYDPSPITININDTVKWINNDTEPHTVTSGLGGGIGSAASINIKGKPSGLFDSGSFKPGESYSLKFNKSGTYNYFCTIHPWMEGIVNVKAAPSNIPSFAVDQNGKQISKFPIYNLTNDKKTEIGIAWNPQVIKTNEPITFILDFFKMPDNSLLHLWPFNFALIQDGKEIFRTSGVSQVGASTERYSFNNPGNVSIKVENAQDPKSFVQFGTIVYKNPNASSSNNNNNLPISSSSGFINPLLLVYSVYAVIIGIPVAVAVIVILIRKKII